ncbi:MAG: MBL fold metallo-hydrolase RNA specificity domain-containing protein [Syntrophobacteraceae bacterium]
MKITCLGAAGCVTGSCFLLDNGNKYLIDCGLFQGGKSMEVLNYNEWGFNPREVSALFLTHAHIDHSGRIPKLVKDGFKGKIYATLPTIELSKILLLDSAHIQEMEAEWQTRKNYRRGKTLVEPLYSVQDAQRCLSLFQEVPLNEPFSLNNELKICFRNAGHILGASILEIWSGCSGSQPHKVVFSGDLGHKQQLIIEDPQSIFSADSLFMESTYGNRDHKSFAESKKELLEAIQYSYQFGEKVIIPSFAVARTQDLLYLISSFFRKGLIPSMPVYLDSPLAIAATEIFRRMKDFYDKDALDLLSNGHDPLDFPQLILSRTAQDSIAINQTSGPAIVIAGNGMCTAGRIKHHLKHNLWRRGCSLVIVGFQASGTLGRKIVEGARTLKVFGESIVVRAKVFTIGGFSAHAGKQDLIEWISHFENPAMNVYVIHGEQTASESFAETVRKQFGFYTHVPQIGDSVSLTPSVERVTAKEIEGAGLQEQLLRIIQKAEALRALSTKTAPTLEPEVLRELELELSKTEARLKSILSNSGAATAEAKS